MPSYFPARLNHLSRVAEQPLHELPVHRALGLTDSELARIVTLLGRDPNHFELAVFSLLWSEHCGYKHSALLLKRLPSTGKRVLQGPGENAGVIDLGDGEAVCFKVESHNHPSAVEPFQGAATGVGGILRDIIAMGARPIALLDGLRFAEADWRFDRAVGGIGHYGNCLAAEERIMYRNSGRMRETTIEELAEERAATADKPVWDAEPRKPFQVLSFDPSTGEAVWKDVCRIFKRQTTTMLKIRTALGRSITVTPDHPVMLWHEGSLVERTARHVQVGDRLPLLAALPETEDKVPEIDLISEVAEPDAIVLLPPDWAASREFRVELRRWMPRADARHYRISRRELPVTVFREVEAFVGVPRHRLKLRLPGPRSTPVPAVLRLEADVARLLGYYIAEGCSSANGTTTKIIWTFGRNDADQAYVADLCGILEGLGIRHSIGQRSSTIAVTVSSRLLGRVFEEVLEIGCRSLEKRVPSQLMQAPAHLRREVLAGIFRGDGTFDFPKRSSAVRVRHSTTSLELHHQLLLLLQSLGIFASRYDWRPSGDLPGGIYRSKEAHALEFYGAEAIEEAARWFLPDDRDRMLAAARKTANSPFARPRARRHGRLASVPVVSIEAIDGPASVYDFEVPGTHLFATAGGIVTHNCVGVPTVGGEAVFDEAYRDNVLVNAMCVGLLPADRVTRASATGPGNLVVLYGATTGRDGIGGASVLASQELGEDDADKRPTVQVGDPFMGKKLIEVSVELVESGLVESLQDCGAAGLASSLSEMARECGIDLRLDRVPLREEGMEPWEVMISESQERMVAVVRPQMLDAVLALCRRWELHHAVVGEVTDTGLLRALWDGDVVGEIPARLLTDECPRYSVAPVPRAKPSNKVLLGELEAPEPRQALLELLGSPNLRSREWIFRRYDHLVGSRTVRRPGFDAAVLRLRPGYRGLAVSLDGTGRMGRLDPRTGGALAVLEAARNVACTGAEPLGLTDCLNFGNPEKGEIAWELAESIEGMAQACEALRVPIVSGNVSLYNETDGRAIDPTPVVGCVGLLQDVRRVPGAWRDGDVVLLAGASPVALAGSELQARYGRVGGRPARLDLAAEAALVDFLRLAAPQCSLVHDVSQGGLAVALAEAAIHSGLGAAVQLPNDLRAWFGEGGGQAVLACSPEVVDLLGGVPLRRLGAVGGDRLLGVSVTELKEAWS